MRHDSYYEQPDYSEFEREETETVLCFNEDCSEFEVEVEVDILFHYAGNFGTATYTCPACKEESNIEVERDSDYWSDPDAAYDAWKESEW